MTLYKTYINKTIQEELTELFQFSSPRRLRQSLQHVLFGFLIHKDDAPLDDRAIEDFQYLIDLLDRVEENLVTD